MEELCKRSIREYRKSSIWEVTRHYEKKLKETKATIQDKMKNEDDPEKAAEEVAQAIDEAAREIESEENATNI